MNESGVDRSPTNKDSEKFRVANVARNIPRSKSEKHWISIWCCSVIYFLTRTASIAGSIRLRIVNQMKKCEVSICREFSKKSIGQMSGRLPSWKDC